MKINTRWFQGHLKTHGITQRKLATMLKLDPGAVSLTLHGGRRMQLDEATAIARLFLVPLDEVLTNAGIKVHEHELSGNLKIKGWLDGELRIHWGKPKGPGSAPNPIALGGKEAIEVIRAQTAGSSMDGIDGALIYYRPSVGIGSDIVGKTCVVGFPGGGAALRVVKRGYRDGFFNLYSLNGNLVEEDVFLESATPVVWMKLG